MAAEVVGDRRGVWVAVGRPRRQAFLDHVLKTHTDHRPASIPWLSDRRSLRRARAAEGVAQQQAQGVQVGAVIDGRRRGTAGGHGGQRLTLLWGHPVGSAAESVGHALAGFDPFPSEVEIQEQRLAVGGDQDVRRLYVHVDQAVRVRFVKRVGEAGRDPADRLRVRRLFQIAAIRAVRDRRRRTVLLKSVDGVQEVTASAIFGRGGGLRENLQDPRQARPSQVGHAERPKPAVGEFLFREQRDDVRVLQPGQREVFVLVAGEDLEDDQPIGEARFGRQKRLARRPSPELGQEVERAEVLADFGKDGGLSQGTEDAVAAEQDFKLVAELGISAHDLDRDDLLARIASEADLLVDQTDGGFGVEFGMFGQDRGG